jgi:hypothetical protein
LWEQSSICEGKCEPGIRLPLDNDAAVNPIIADGQVLDAHREIVGLAGEFDQSGTARRGVDQKLMTRQLAAGGCARLTLPEIEWTGRFWAALGSPRRDLSGSIRGDDDGTSSTHRQQRRRPGSHHRKAR